MRVHTEENGGASADSLPPTRRVSEAVLAGPAAIHNASQPQPRERQQPKLSCPRYHHWAERDVGFTGLCRAPEELDYLCDTVSPSSESTVNTKAETNRRNTDLIIL